MRNFLIILFLACYSLSAGQGISGFTTDFPNEDVFRVKERKHRFKRKGFHINWRALGKSSKLAYVDFEIDFTDENFYVPIDREGDLNKACGIAFYKGLFEQFTPDRNNAMISWRSVTWLSNQFKLEITPYSDLEYDNRFDLNHTVEIYPAKILDVNTLKRIAVFGNRLQGRIIRISKDNYEVQVKTSRGYYSTVFEVDERKRANLISPWFGGNAPAPHDMSFTMRWKVVKK